MGVGRAAGAGAGGHLFCRRGCMSAPPVRDVFGCYDDD